MKTTPINTAANQMSENSPEIKRIAKRRILNYASLPKISISEIPPISKGSTQVQELLRQIHKGEAVIISENVFSLETAAAAVRRLRKKAEFKNFTVTRRTISGEKKLYIANEEK
jgi:hypothetical protein